MSNEQGREEVNVVAAAVRIAGGPKRVAEMLSISRSQVYRWINARTMANATYIYVAKLARLSGIQTQFLGGDGGPSAIEEASVEKGLATEPLMSSGLNHRRPIRRQVKLPTGREMLNHRNHAVRAREIADE
jgi:hypothetical protein